MHSGNPLVTSPKLEMSPAEADLKEPEPSSPFNRMIPMNPSYRSRIRDETMDVALFSNAFRDAVAIEYADEYAVNFVKACMWPHNPVEVSRLELGELGVRVGHREGILAVLANMRRGAAVQDDLEHSDEALFTALPLDDPDFAPGVSMCMLSDDAHLETHMTTFMKDSVWVDMHGCHRTMDMYLGAIRRALTAASLPAAFIRLFLNNKPMPFHMKLPTKNGRIVHGMLLRVPLADIMPEDRGAPTGLTTQATTLHRMANRLAIIYDAGTAQRRGILLTYRKDSDIKWVKELKSKWTVDVRDTIQLSHVATRLIAESMEAFRDVLHALQQELEVCSSLPDSFRPKDVVKTLSRVQRQAAVMRRCLSGNLKVLNAAEKELIFGDELSTCIALVEDLKEVADELETNAAEMLNLRLAMIDFKSQTNMKLFTHMTVVMSPLTLLTGWFGMNFEDMKELKIEGFYYGVAVFAVVVIGALTTVLWWMNRDRLVSADDAADAEIVLAKAEVEDD
jgi:hypothetical protein